MAEGHDASRATTRRKTMPKSSLAPEEVIDRLRRTSRTMTYHHPAKTLEVGGEPPIRITV
jgi:hypothetical protein